MAPPRSEQMANCVEGWRLSLLSIRIDDRGPLGRASTSGRQHRRLHRQRSALGGVRGYHVG